MKRNFMMIVKKYLPGHWNTADHFTEGSQPKIGVLRSVLQVKTKWRLDVGTRGKKFWMKYLPMLTQILIVRAVWMKAKMKAM